MDALYCVVIPLLICLSPNHFKNTIPTESFFEWFNVDVLYIGPTCMKFLFVKTDFEPIR